MFCCINFLKNKPRQPQSVSIPSNDLVVLAWVTKSW
jgi:hypothetical protein